MPDDPDKSPKLKDTLPPIPPKPKGGRPSKLTPELEAAIISRLKLCGTLEDVSAICGVTMQTLHNWRERGRKQQRGKFRRFFDAVQQAQQDRNVARESSILLASRKDWKALAWLMERTNPKMYAPRVYQHINEELDRAIERLQVTFKNEPAILERALASIAGFEGPGGMAPNAAGEGDPGGGAGGGGGEAIHPSPAEPEAEAGP